MSLALDSRIHVWIHRPGGTGFTMGNTSARTGTVRAFEHPVAFWAGTFACSVGVALHLPMYYSARDMGYKMSGRTPDAPMVIGMALILIGLPLVLYGLLPRRSGEIVRSAARIEVRPLDDAPLRAQHVILLLVMAVAVTIDVMKPAEVYPTRVRTRGAGLAAGMTKLGGVLILVVVLRRASVPSIAQTAVIGAVPLALAILAFWRAGAETKGRTLEAITGEELVGELV
jgi:hypothetical protein